MVNLVHRCQYTGCCVGRQWEASTPTWDKIDQAQRQAQALVKALRDMANARHAAPNEGYPGPGDLDDLTDQADALSALLDGITA